MMNDVILCSKRPVKLNYHDFSISTSHLIYFKNYSWKHISDQKINLSINTSSLTQNAHVVSVE